MKGEFRVFRIGKLEVALSNHWSSLKFTPYDFGGLFIGPLRIRWGGGWCLSGADWARKSYDPLRWR